MTKHDMVGYSVSLANAEEYFRRCCEAEKLMGPLSFEERLSILKSLGSPLTLGELCEAMKGKRVLNVKNGKESASNGL